jgi:DNA-binding LacI/PurR family transcriptional regulator
MKRRTASGMPAMADVAALANVSVPTVSRVVQGTVPVSEEKRKRVLAAIEELDYRPSATARALAHGTSTIVGVFAAQASAYGYAATIEGIHDEARRNGWTVAVGLLDAGPEGDAADLQRALDPILTQRLVGAIVIGFDPIAFDTIELLRRRHRVVVASGSLADVAGIDQVHLDDYAGAYEATTRLLELGHETVHHGAGAPHSSTPVCRRSPSRGTCPGIRPTRAMSVSRCRRTGRSPRFCAETTRSRSASCAAWASGASGCRMT